MSDALCFISLIDETGKPLLIHVTSGYHEDTENILKFNVFSNIALDYFESQLFESSSLETQNHIKLLFNLEGVEVYGLLMKTKNFKFVIGFEENKAVKESKIDEIFETVKTIYLKAALNPFVIVDEDDSQNKSILVDKIESQLTKEFT